MNKIIIIANPLEPKEYECYEAKNLNAFLFQYFSGECPENLRIYHNGFSKKSDVTPKNKADIEKLETLKGTFYVVIYPAYDPVGIIIAIIAIVMALTAVYMIATMPKP